MHRIATTLTLNSAKHNLEAFVGADDNRYDLENIQYRADIGAFVATDGRMLAVAYVDEQEEPMPSESFLLPGDVFANIRKGAFTANVNASTVVVMVGDKRRVRKGCGKFPDVRPLLTKATGVRVTFDATLLRKICDHVLSIDAAATLRIRLNGPEGPARITAGSFDGPSDLGVEYVLMPVVIKPQAEKQSP